MPGVTTPHPDRNLALELVRVTESAAMGAGRWIGRGDKIAADQAAVDAMRAMLDTVVMDGVVVPLLPVVLAVRDRGVGEIRCD